MTRQGFARRHAIRPRPDRSRGRRPADRHANQCPPSCRRHVRGTGAARPGDAGRPRRSAGRPGSRCHGWACAPSPVGDASAPPDVRRPHRHHETSASIRGDFIEVCALCSRSPAVSMARMLCVRPCPTPTACWTTMSPARGLIYDYRVGSVTGPSRECVGRRPIRVRSVPSAVEQPDAGHEPSVTRAGDSTDLSARLWLSNRGFAS